jgi:hypothetical protein
VSSGILKLTVDFADILRFLGNAFGSLNPLDFRAVVK